MEGWPRIPNQNSASSSRPKSTIPAPGTVVMASVEEELGDGVYSLRWGGNRISVTSRSPLKTGQSLILKSETNADGKPTLVVQGPALPEPGSITGRIIYGPGKNRTQSKQNNAADNAAASRENHQQGNQIAAGTSKAMTIQAPTPMKPMQDLIGAVLEPLPEFEASVKILEEAVKEEKERLEEKSEKEQKKAEAEKRGERTQDADSDADEIASVHDRRTRPAPGRHGAQSPAAAGSGAPAQGVAVGGQPADAARPPLLDQFGRPIAPPPVQTPQRPQEGAPPPTADAPLPQRPDSVAPPARPSVPVPPVTVPPSGQAPAPSAPVPAEPPGGAATVLPESAGPKIPEPLPAPLPQSTVAPTMPPPPMPAASGQTIPPVPAAPAQPQGVGSAENAPPSVSSQPGQVTPPSPIPATVVVAPESSGPIVPEPLPAPVSSSGGPAGNAPPPPPPAPPAPPAPSGPTVAIVPPSHTGVGTPESAVPAVPESLPAAPSRSDVPVATTQPPAATAQAPVSTTQAPATVVVQPERAGPVVPEPLPAVVQGSGNSGAATVPGTPAAATPPATIPPANATVPTETIAPMPSAPVHIVAPAPAPQTATPPPTGAQAQGATPVPLVLPDNAGPVVLDTPAPHPPQPVEPGQPPAKPAETAVPPEAAPMPPPRQSGNYGPSRSDTDTIRARQATLPSADMADLETVEARTGAKPEVVLKEALTQMVKAAELPLAGGANVPPLSLVAKPPPETLDKAAELLLQAAGVTPDTESVAAARALIKQNVHIDRDSVQTVLTAAAEAPEPDREAVMNAAARLLSKDIPVSPPLVAGLVDVLDRRAGTHALMHQAQEALAIDPDNPQAQKLMEAAGDLLDMLHVDLASPDAPEALERYLSTFGRETLGKALALVETAAQAILEGSPELQRLDQAISAVLTELTDELAQVQTQELADEKIPTPQDAAPPPSKDPSTPIQATPLPARPLPSAPINAYLNAPRAFDIAEALKNLPPMPQNITINSPVPQEAPPLLPQPLPAPLPNLMPPPDGSVPQGDGTTTPQPAPGTPAPPTPAPMPPAGEGFLMPKLDTLFQIPGLNRPELELLKPSGFMERFLQSSVDGPDAQQVKEDARTLLRQLTSEDARQVERGLRDVKNKSGDVLRETAARLNEREVEVIRNNTVLNRLADAATSLRDLGRQLLAVKAENLAGQDREPGVMLAEVPFKLNDDAGEGRMQMFYRRRKDKGEGWNNRVILDLNTTRMGPVLGDMRFFGQDMVLNMFVEHQETAKYLEASGNDLIAALAEKGFRVKARFMVLPLRTAPEIRADRPVIAGEESAATSSDGGRLDIKG
ncbi:MAG: hypothetical protein LUC93_02430 [Planctomycetaceae bacterium]|nr:hypothetical protein [Planctomycetaceae bacterium]